MIWGVRGTGNRDGRGLAKIIAYHPEVIDELPEIIANLKVIEDNEKMGRMILADDVYTAVIDTAYIAAEGAEKKEIIWLMTAFAIKPNKARKLVRPRRAPNRSDVRTAPDEQHRNQLGEREQAPKLDDDVASRDDDMPNGGN